MVNVQINTCIYIRFTLRFLNAFVCLVDRVHRMHIHFFGVKQQNATDILFHALAVNVSPWKSQEAFHRLCNKVRRTMLLDLPDFRCSPKPFDLWT